MIDPEEEGRGNASVLGTLMYMETSLASLATVLDYTNAIWQLRECKLVIFLVHEPKRQPG